MTLNLEEVSTRENALIYLELVASRGDDEQHFSREGLGRLAVDFGLLPGLLGTTSKAWLKQLSPEETAFRMIVMAKILSASGVPGRILHLIAESAKKKKSKPLPFTDFETSPETLFYYLQEQAYKEKPSIREELKDYISGYYSRCKYRGCGKTIAKGTKSERYCSAKCQELDSAEEANNCTVLALGSNPKSRVRNCIVSECRTRFWSYHNGNRKCEECKERERKSPVDYKPHRISPELSPDALLE